MHAVAYSLLSYLTAWMKVYYPVEFMTALLTAKSDNTSKLSVIITDCHRMGIKVLPPKINESEFSFKAKPETKEILFGFGAVKGIGESVITKIIENQPYSSFDDYLSKIQDKAATIALIKAGAFPTSNKMKLMRKYAALSYDKKEYKPVQSYGTKAKLLLNWDINVDDYKAGKKVDKEAVLQLYNAKRKEKFDQVQEVKYKAYMTEFQQKYARDQFLWEYESLSMFLTENPLQEGVDLINANWDDVPNGEKTVVLCVISDIKRKKDKNNNPFAYLDLITSDRIIEATIWSRQLKEYFDLISKGKCLAILGRKENDHLFVEKVKPYTVWLEKIKHTRAKKTS
jgi:DNA polymerase-3 subunit alpha